jgi:hypothetical protein
MTTADPDPVNRVGAMSDVPLEDLSFEDLRKKAFSYAERHLDVGFFTDLFSHMPGMAAIEGEGGDLGAVGGTIIESVRAWREMVGDEQLDETTETLLRARFVTYLREHGEG